jgi:hypothetical protein
MEPKKDSLQKEFPKVHNNALEPKEPQLVVSPIDKEHLEQACQKAQEQIRGIEARINSERENWYQNIKQKEEEGIALKAQIDTLLFRSDKERAKRESELSLLQQQIQSDLAEVERVLGDDVKSWTQRLSEKEKELEETKHQSVFLEAQKKMEVEKNLRGLQTTLDQAKQKYKTLNTRLSRDSFSRKRTSG